MMDSNQFHAVCLDTFPPIHYLNDTSRCIQAMVHGLNTAVGATRFAYSYDAGPNAVLLTGDSTVDDGSGVMGVG